MNAALQMETGRSRESFWQRRVVGVVAGQLKQGISSERIAVTIALGLVIGVFPILGSTTVLCGLAAVMFRLNQPIIQLTNYFAYPLQLILLIPIYRAGEWAFGKVPTPLSIPLLFERFQADVLQFLKDFGVIALQGIFVWCVVAPIVGAMIYGAVCPLMRMLANRIACK